MISITEENYALFGLDENNYKLFHPVGRRAPYKGEVIASYRATAELIDGGEKRQIISLLLDPESIVSATKVMQRLCYAIDEHCMKVLKEMLQDLSDGMTVDEVAAKPYEYTLELLFYTTPGNIPEDNPHWMQISILNSESLDAKLVGGTEEVQVLKGNSDGGCISDSETTDFT